MGEAAEAMLDGTLCAACGVYLGECTGQPEYCAGCSPVEEIEADQVPTKKQRNMAQSTQLLVERGVKFSTHNQGIHLIVYSSKGKIDFWPSTGKYIVRNGPTGRGVFNLLKYIGK